MLIPKNISPDDCVYVNATHVLACLFEHHEQTTADLYCAVRRKRQMTYALFVLCLDWLYLIDAITINDELIALCS
ncbi:MAG: hypothetical protein KBT44_04655 [Bacteroidales bacterium]|nr:hypothetical protein [Candidatus Equibacterium intestinale]